MPCASADPVREISGLAGRFFRGTNSENNVRKTDKQNLFCQVILYDPIR